MVVWGGTGPHASTLASDPLRRWRRVRGSAKERPARGTSTVVSAIGGRHSAKDVSPCRWGCSIKSGFGHTGGSTFGLWNSRSATRGRGRVWRSPLVPLAGNSEVMGTTPGRGGCWTPKASRDANDHRWYGPARSGALAAKRPHITPRELERGGDEKSTLRIVHQDHLSERRCPRLPPSVQQASPSHPTVCNNRRTMGVALALSTKEEEKEKQPARQGPSWFAASTSLLLSPRIVASASVLKEKLSSRPYPPPIPPNPSATRRDLPSPPPC